ncbi:hypothetical protein D050_0489A, partial [Vibrio parahaemolyticus VPCR-2009]
MKAYFLNEKE